MNTKNYLTLAGIVGVVYGLAFFLFPEQSQSFYGLSDQSNELAIRMQRFFGGSIIAMGFLGLMARNASASVGRKAVLGGLSVFFILNLVQIGMWLAKDAPTFSFVDAVVTLVLGIGAVYFYRKE
jgi:NO-binding membrane sensor protein with MHYT domain